MKTMTDTEAQVLAALVADYGADHIIGTVITTETEDGDTTIDNGVSDETYISMARAEHARDGEIEIDDGANVSRSDDGGAYVQAWVWVYNPKT